MNFILIYFFKLRSELQHSVSIVLQKLNWNLKDINSDVQDQEESSISNMFLLDDCGE